MRKRILAALMTVCMLILSIPSIYAAEEQYFLGNGMSYILDDEGNLTIKGNGDMMDYTGSPWGSDSRNSIKTVTIEEGVTSVGDYTFSSCKNLTSVTLPNSLNRIGRSAFEGCEIESIIIPDNVTHIGERAFSMSSLKNVTLGKSLKEVGEYALYASNRLENVYITDLAAYASGGYRANINRYGRLASNIYINNEPYPSELIIPEGVTEISDYAFYYFENLTSITIPDSVERIGEDAFRDCTNLENVTLGSGIKEIGNGAFANCHNLNVNIKDLRSYADIKFGDELSNPLINSGKPYINNVPLSGDVVIPDGVKNIPDRLFQGCDAITSITIPDSVERIGKDAFRDCKNLESITLGSGIKEIGKDAFGTGGNLKNIYINDLAAYLNISFENSWANPMINSGKTLYLDNNPIRGRLTIPDGVTKIQDYTFQNCTDITHISIPDSVTYIGDYAFSGCTGLTNTLTIPDTVTHIGDCAFSGCAGLNGPLKLPESLAYIGGGAFSGCKGFAYTLKIPSGVTHIGGGAFENCGIDNIVIPESVGEIESSAFDGTAYYKNPDHWANGAMYIDKRLIAVNRETLPQDYTILEGTTEISDYAFSGCENLKSVTIPDTVTRIGNFAFNECRRLTSIKIPDSVTNIGKGAFYYCTGLTKVTTPETVKHIGDNAFSCCYNLNEAEIMGGSVGIGTFDHCDYLQTVTIGENVTQIGLGMASYIKTVNFNATECDINNTDLSGRSTPVVNIGENVTVIPNNAFQGSSMTSVKIPKSVKRIGEHAFWECADLANLYIEDLAAYLNIEFCGNYSSPMEYNYKPKKIYLNDELITSLVIPEGVTKIPYKAFSHCGDITSVKLPKSLKSVGDSAFYGCDNLSSVYIEDLGAYLSIDFSGEYMSHPFEGDKNIERKLYLNNEPVTSLVIPEGVTKIPAYSFYRCADITSLTLPKSLSAVEYDAFECPNLQSVHIEDLAAYLNIDFQNGSSSPISGLRGELYLNGEKITSLNVPEGVVKIPERAFHECETITSLTLPDSLTCIRAAAFAFCRFSNIVIPDNVTSIGHDAFSGVYCLKSVTLPKGIKSIGGGAFDNTFDLTDVYYAGTEEEWKSTYIGAGNEHLLNATIHYNSTGPSHTDDPTKPTPAPTPTPIPTPKPTPIPTTTAEITRTDTETDTAYSFEVDAADKYENCYVYAAVYDADGVLLNVKRVPLETADETVVSVDKNENAAEAKVFIWADNTQPVTEAKKFVLK